MKVSMVLSKPVEGEQGVGQITWMYVLAPVYVTQIMCFL